VPATLPAGRAAAWLPLFGAILGAAGAGIYLVVVKALSPSIAALAAVIFWAALSRPGALGTVGILLSVIARWQALDHVATPGIVAACIASQAVARAGMVALAWVSRPVEVGLSSTLTTPAALAAAAQGIAAAFLCGLRTGIAILVGAYLLIRLARWYSYRRIGGVNSTSLGSTEQLLEILVLVMN